MIPDKDVWGAVLLLASLLIYALLTFLVLFFIMTISIRFFEPETKAQIRAIVRETFVIGLPMSILGAVTGFMCGGSVQPAVTALIPAFLTFVGGIAVYMVGKGPLRAFQAGFLIITLSAAIFFGTQVGSEMRTEYEAEQDSAAVRKARADVEFDVNQYRHALGLPDEAPAPK